MKTEFEKLSAAELAERWVEVQKELEDVEEAYREARRAETVASNRRNAVVTRYKNITDEIARRAENIRV